ncbi:MAG: hypothetical protein LBL32_02815, partial [Holosporales bacterium]|nr:hypothetical protein [Holosporales bacterium]
RASNELKKQGIIISAGGVRSVWLRYYNRERPHSGKYCYGKAPYQTFLNSKHIALEKINESMYKEAAPDGCDLYDSQIA